MVFSVFFIFNNYHSKTNYNLNRCFLINPLKFSSSFFYIGMEVLSLSLQSFFLMLIFFFLQQKQLMESTIFLPFRYGVMGLKVIMGQDIIVLLFPFLQFFFII